MVLGSSPVWMSPLPLEAVQATQIGMGHSSSVAFRQQHGPTPQASAWLSIVKEASDITGCSRVMDPNMALSYSYGPDVPMALRSASIMAFEYQPGLRWMT